MLTATKDLVLPTTVTGSWPRPSWFDGNLHERPFSTGMADVRYRELLPAFKPYKGNLPKKVAVGMIGHRRLQVETPEDVAAQGANIVRGELGAKQTEVRAADPALQVDVPALEPEPVSA